MSTLRKTRLVKRLLRAFDQGHAALSVVELVEQLQEDMNKTTVYRILDRLEWEGILHSFLGGQGLKWYAKGKPLSPASPRHAHPHFQCRRWGKMECLPMEVMIPSLPGRRVDSVALLLIGQCGACEALQRLEP